jgi:uncharacterized protein YaiL (DUF2058 family)
MSQSLRDQLIKAGLASAPQARKAERQQRAEQHQTRATKGHDKPGARPDRAAPGPGAPKPEHATAGAASPTLGTAAPGTAAPAERSARERARQQRAEKAAHDRELQRAQNAKAAEKALRAELKQLIHAHDQRVKTNNDDDVPYNFVHGKRVKRIYVPKAQQALLSSGQLVIVNDDGRYHLITPEIAERVRARDPKRIIAAHNEEKPAGDAMPAPGSDEEYYAKFQVPDDLDW